MIIQIKRFLYSPMLVMERGFEPIVKNPFYAYLAHNLPVSLFLPFVLTDAFSF